MFISWMFITPSFQKSLIVEQFQGNYLKTSNLVSLKCILENLRFRDGLVWTIRPAVEIKLRSVERAPTDKVCGFHLALDVASIAGMIREEM